MTLRQVVHTASEVFVGTVRAKRALAVDRLIHTEVTFGDLKVLKGRVPDTTVRYRFAGGTLGDRTLTAVGMPEFKVGRRYVMFANAASDPLCPAVGWTQGRYTVKKEEGTGHEIVCNSVGRPVYRFANGRPVTRPFRKSDRPIRLDLFLEMVKRMVERDRRAQTTKVPPEDKPTPPEEPKPNEPADGEKKEKVR